MYAQQAATAYKTQNQQTLGPRAIEHRVFSQITARLEQVQSLDNPPISQKEEALHDNMLLWNALAADVMHETNGLPEALKAQIIYLAKYMSHHTGLVRSGDADLKAMIEINETVMTGLAMNPAEAIAKSNLIIENSEG